MRQRPRGRWWAGAIRLLLAGGVTFAGAAAPLARAADAGSAASGVAGLLDALKSNRLGSFYLSLRPRYRGPIASPFSARVLLLLLRRGTKKALSSASVAPS